MLLAQHNQVVAIDIVAEKVAMRNYNPTQRILVTGGAGFCLFMTPTSWLQPSRAVRAP